MQEDIYQINDLKFITSKTKYRNNKFRILSARMKTVNSQNENLITNWQILYSYNRNNVLTSVKQKTKVKTEKIIEMKLAIPLFVKNCIISWPVANPAPITIPQYAKANLNSSLIFKKTTPTYI